MSEIDLTPILEVVLTGLAALLAVGGELVRRNVSSLLNLKEDSEVRVYLDQAIFGGINFANGVARDLAARNATVTTNERVATAANYVIEHVPDAVNRFDLTQGHLEQIIRARLEAWSGSGTGLADTVEIEA